MNAKQKSILVLDMNLFPDREMMVSAVEAIDSGRGIRRIAIDAEQMDQSAWAKVLGEIMNADMLVAF